MNNDSLHTNKCWFALYTKPRHEFKAAEQLEKLNIHYYLPVVNKVNQWSDRKKKIAEPLLRGYIFIHADEKERRLSLEEFSILRCVFDNGKPAVIPDWQMDNLSNFLMTESEYYIYEGLIPGMKVRINEGPFQGVIGVIQQTENHNTLAVTIELLNRSVLAHISKETIFEVIKKETR